MLNKVTITGPDDSINPQDLFKLYRQYPFVEWGILIAESQQGNARFPSYKWIAELLALAQREDIRLSLHVCGKWVRDICEGNWAFISRFGYLEDFERVQLNFHAYTHLLTDDFFVTSKKIQEERCVQFIFQLDGLNDPLIQQAINEDVEAYPLYDLSGGAGILPKAWEPAFAIYTGYAGGLGPTNLAEQLNKIDLAAGKQDYWVDMETRVRSNNDQQFDLIKVGQCLEIAQRFMNEQQAA